MLLDIVLSKRYHCKVKNILQVKFVFNYSGNILNHCFITILNRNLSSIFGGIKVNQKLFIGSVKKKGGKKKRNIIRDQGEKVVSLF